MTKVKKVDIWLFVILLVLQNFAIYSNSRFGINGLVGYLIIVSIVCFKRYYLLINKKIFFPLVFLVFCLIFFNMFNQTIFITQILKTILQIWLFYASYIYLKDIYSKHYEKYFWKVYSIVLFLLLLYGIYEFFAIRNEWSLVLNVFSNNPSYAVRSMTHYYSGWNGKYRLYNVFFEPSVFSLFLVINIFLILQNRYISKHLKVFIILLSCFNLIFSYSRTGYVTFVYFCGIYIFYKFISRKQKSFFDFLFLLLPFINIYIMYFVGGMLFDDMSYKLRFNSSLYYLKNSFDSIRHIFLGHGCGSVVNNVLDIQTYVAASAQNGYSDFLYQFGYVPFVYLFMLALKKIRNITNDKFLLVGVLSVFCCLGCYYMVETILVLVVLTIVFCEEGEKKFDN